MIKIKRLLIYRFGQIGDTIIALPSLWHLREQFPDAHFTLLSEVPVKGTHMPPEQILPKGLIQEYLKYSSGSSFGQLKSLARMALTLRRTRFDASVYLVPSVRSPKQRGRDALFFRLAGITRMLGFSGFSVEPNPRLADCSLMTVVHESDALLSRLAKSGLPEVTPGTGRMEMGISLQEQSTADKWWENHRGTERSDQKWFAVCAGSKWPSKQWPAERYLEVGQRLIVEHDLLPIVFGGPEDRELGRHLITAWGRGACAAGDLSVRESAALLRGAAFYLGNDTGVMHLAAAVGRPCVAIFSALDWPGRWHPYGSGHKPLRFSVPCAGCLSEVCKHHLECLMGIEIEQVYKSCLEVLCSETKPYAVVDQADSPPFTY